MTFKYRFVEMIALDKRATYFILQGAKKHRSPRDLPDVGANWGAGWVIHGEPSAPQLLELTLCPQLGPGVQGREGELA